VSKWRDCTSGDATNIKTGLPRALVTHFGSMTSDASGKFYDKALQMQDTKESSDLGADHWLRFEILFRDSRAEQVADYFCQSGDLVACVGILRNYVDFKERPAKEGEQRSRLPTVSWWNDFCMACEKVQLWQGPKIRTIEDRAEWMAYQGSKTLAMVTEAYSGDMSWITDMIEAGKARLTDNDRCLITRFKNNEI
jgi:DNA relaxase NicK